MLLSGINIPRSETYDVDLQEINMQRLSRFVVLTGKNGAGKTRVLHKISHFIEARQQHAKNLHQYRENIKSSASSIARQPDSPHVAVWQQNIAQMKKYIEYITDRIYLSENVKDVKCVPFVPKTLTLQDARQHPKASLLAHYNQAKSPGFANSAKACLAYIQSLQDLKREATHPDSLIAETEERKKEREELINEYQALEKLIFSLLKTQLGRSLEGDATIFNKPLADANLSDGQRVLLQLLVAIHAQSGNLENVVLLMDEPENHLHPSALVECLDTLSKAAPSTQFFIATHSVPLLSYIAAQDPMAIWYVEEGKVTNAGKYPEKVLKSLLGEESQLAALQAFIALPAQYAAINYAVESLYEPKTIGATSKDPQVKQIRDVLNMSKDTSPIAILDFGAGKGRLLAGLDEIFKEDVEVTKDRIHFQAFEPYQASMELCDQLVNDIYADGKKRVFKNREEFFTQNADACIDVVTMCNVLHEIPPNDWSSLFNETSLIFRALKDSGHLLVVEDQRIPVGEKAHQFGFIVLDTPHLRTLFAVTEKDIEENAFVSNDHRGDGRLKAHLIRKDLLSRLTTETRRKAIEQLKATARDRMVELRNDTPSYLNGQLNGFWTQQFANTSLFLEQ